MSIVILCGMPSELKVLKRVFPGFTILSGADKLSLHILIPGDCTRIVVSGLFGGLAPGIPVGSICMAETISDQSGDVFECDAKWNDAVLGAGVKVGMRFGVVPWYSSGVLDQADSAVQRADLFHKGFSAIDDEARYAVAEAQRRKIPCNDFRSCSDDWTETLPLAATGAIMNKNGTANEDYLFRSIAEESIHDTLDLGQIAFDYAKSLHTFETALNAVKFQFVDGAT